MIQFTLLLLSNDASDKIKIQSISFSHRVASIRVSFFQVLDRRNSCTYIIKFLRIGLNETEREIQSDPDVLHFSFEERKGKNDEQLLSSKLITEEREKSLRRDH